MTAAILPFGAGGPQLDARQQAQVAMKRAARQLRAHAQATGDWEPVFIAEAVDALADNQPGAALAVVRSWSLLRQDGGCRAAGQDAGADATGGAP